MVVINPWRRKREAQEAKAQDEFEELCAAIVGGRMRSLGFDRGLPGYKFEVGELLLLFEADADEFVRAYPGADADSAEMGCIDLWIYFHESSGEWEAEMTGSDFYLDDSQTTPMTDWRTDPSEVLSAVADALSVELERLRDPAAADAPRKLEGRRGWSPLMRGE
jgi:hypothetical protein